MNHLPTLAVGIAVLACNALPAQAPPPPGNFAERVLRGLSVSGLAGGLRDTWIVDDDGDGAKDAWMTFPSVSKVYRFDGFRGTYRLHQGPSGTQFGGKLVVTEAWTAGQLNPVIFSTSFGNEYVSVLSNNFAGTQLVGRSLPNDHTVVRWALPIQADTDAQMEIAYGARGYMSGLGVVAIYDPQTNGFMTLATGTVNTDEFATQGCVIHDAVNGDSVIVSSPGATSDQLHRITLAGTVTPLGGLPSGSGTGRHGLSPIGTDELWVLSGGDTFTPNPSGRMDCVNLTTGTWTPFEIGASNELFTSINQAPVSGKVYYTKKAIGQQEEVYEFDLGASNPTPTLRVQATYGTGLRLDASPLQRAFAGVPTETIGVIQDSLGSLSLYKPDGGPLDVRVEPLGASSGTNVTINVNFTTAGGNALALPVFSFSVPTLTPVPQLGFSIGLTPDAITIPTLGAAPGAPFLADAQGQFSYQIMVPTLGLGGFTQAVSYGVVAITPGGAFIASQDPATNHWIVQ